MKKITILIIVGVLLCASFHLQADDKLSVKMSFGFAHGGKVEGQAVSTTGFFGYQAAEPEQAGFGMDFCLEFTYRLSPNFGLALGFGFINKSMNGHTGIFTDDQVNMEIFSYEPELVSEIYPITLSGIFTLPLSEGLDFNLLGGVGYYFGNIEVREANRSNQTEDPDYFPWRLGSNVNTFGFHGGGAFDISVGGGLIISLEAIYRSVSFSNFNTEVVQALIAYGPPEELGGQSTFFYAEQQRGEVDMGDLDYQVSNLSLSGFVLKAGFKLRF